MSYKSVEICLIRLVADFLTAKGAKIYAKFTKKINYQSLEMVLLYDFRHLTFDKFSSLLSLSLLSVLSFY